MAVVAQEFLEIYDRGIAKLIGLRSKVAQIVMDQMNGYSPEQIHEQYPHLSMAQIHAALACYYTHQDEVDAQIEEGRRFTEEMRARNPNRLTRADYRAMDGTLSGPAVSGRERGRRGLIRMSVALEMDEHVPSTITIELKRRGVDVLCAQNDGHASTDDEIILDSAAVLGWVAFTRDRDFLVIAQARQVAGVSFAGVVFAHQLGPSIGQCVDELEAIAGATNPSEWVNRVEYLSL